VRRGAARPRRSDQAAAGETLSRAGRRPHRRACMGCRAPQAPSTRTRLGVPACGRSAWWPRRSGCRPRLRHPVHVLGQRPVSSVRCERPVSTLACPRDRCPVSGAGVGASRVSGVRCRRPVSASGVCALPRALCPAEVRSWSAAWAGSPYGWDGRVGVVARCAHDRLVVCLSRRLVLEAGAGAVGPAEASVWTWPSSSGGGWAVASSTAWPTRIGRVHARMVRWWEPGRSEARLLRQADRHAAGESLGRSCRVEPNIKKPIGHIPLAKQN
jgi:hypothetical protein